MYVFRNLLVFSISVQSIVNVPKMRNILAFLASKSHVTSFPSFIYFSADWFRTFHEKSEMVMAEITQFTYAARSFVVSVLHKYFQHVSIY